MLEVLMVDDWGAQGSLMLNPIELRRFTSIEPKIISINSAFRPERRRVEAFIGKTYRDAFGAEIQKHYPTLISAQDRDGRILAAAGFRFARSERLFLESYLEEPIEEACSKAISPVARAEIAEIGSLASIGRGASVFLFLALARHLDQQGVKIAAVTATSRLRRMFRAADFQSTQLARAETARLPDNGAQWGSYYNSDPVVLAGFVREGREGLQRLYTHHSAPVRISRLHHDCGEAV